MQMLDFSGKRFLLPSREACDWPRRQNGAPFGDATIALRRGHRTRTGNWNSESLKGDPRYAGLPFPIPGHFAAGCDPGWIEG